MKLTRPSTIRKRLIRITGKILAAFQSLEFLSIKASLTLKKVTYRRPLYITAPKATLFCARRQVTLRAGTSITQVIIEKH